MLFLLELVVIIVSASDINGHYTDTWVVHVKGGREVAQLLAEEHHYNYIGTIDGFDDYYRMSKKDFAKRNGVKRDGKVVTFSKQLVDHPMVVWAEQQYARPREKRGAVVSASYTEQAGDYEEDYSDEEETSEEEYYEEDDDDNSSELKGYEDIVHPRDSRGIFSWFLSRYSFIFNDTLWTKQWYLQDYRTDGDVPVLDLNVVPCYANGITGKGVRIAILDDGLEWTHPDLRDNYDPEISIDFIDGDRDPMPRYGNGSNNAHGTRCAGEIAMKANNNFCGVGISYNARVGGIKILDGPTTDVVEGSALVFALDCVDIYSNSWGPPDDGKTVEAPGKMATKAFETGIKKGRGGRGAIYIFAAGNGKSFGDSCSADGYIQSIYTIPVASATQRGDAPFYGERCAAIMTTAYSSGDRSEEKIATTDINGGCTTKHSGTSAAAPLAAGITALTLQANRLLSWRDMQHLIVWTSEVAVLGDDMDWQQNGAGFWVNPNFGFGLLNAYNMIKMAIEFKTVPEKSVCNVTVPMSDSVYSFSTNRSACVKFETDGCLGNENGINFLEHLQVTISVAYPYRGAIKVSLDSPSGLKTALMEVRKNDNSSEGLRNWTLTTVHNWGERPDGIWKVNVSAESVPGCRYAEGRVKSISIKLHGTEEMPDHYKNGRRKYSTYRFNKKKPN